MRFSCLANTALLYWSRSAFAAPFSFSNFNFRSSKTIIVQGLYHVRRMSQFHQFQLKKLGLELRHIYSSLFGFKFRDLAVEHPRCSVVARHYCDHFLKSISRGYELIRKWTASNGVAFFASTKATA